MGDVPYVAVLAFAALVALAFLYAHGRFESYVEAAAASRGRTTNVTFFDDPTGFTGVNLFEVPKRVRFRGRTVYPVAVHHDHAAAWLYKVVQVTVKRTGRTLLGYVVDICDRKDSPCRNKDHRNIGFLIDVHKTGWGVLGQTTGIEEGTVRVVGGIPPSQLDKRVFIKGASTYVMARCTGRCEGAEQKWVEARRL